MFFKSLPTMTELEVKESKVILKSDDDAVDYGASYVTDHLFNQDIKQIPNKLDEKNIDYSDYVEEGTPNATIDDFMQYVTKGPKDMGSNIIYIQNGEVVQDPLGQKSQDSLVLQVEAMVDGSQELLDIFTGGDSIGCLKSATKTEDLNN